MKSVRYFVVGLVSVVTVALGVTYSTATLTGHPAAVPAVSHHSTDPAEQSIRRAMEAQCWPMRQAAEWWQEKDTDGVTSWYGRCAGQLPPSWGTRTVADVAADR